MAAPKNPGGNAGQGRRRGVPNKATRELKDIAGKYTKEAVLALAEVMGDANAPAVARVSAATALLDRAHGRPRQQIEHTGNEGGPIEIADVRERLAGAVARLSSRAGEGEAAREPDLG